MGVSSGKPVHARNRDGEDRAPDPAQASSLAWAVHQGLCAGLILWLLAGPLAAETLKFATFNVSMGRKGPGLLLRDIVEGRDPDIGVVVEIIARVAPDVLLLTDFDQDLHGVTLAAFAELLASRGLPYPHRFAPMSNAGSAAGLDLDVDGRRGGPEDSHGYGDFPGAGGMAILSRLPLDVAAARDFSGLLWADLPGADLPDAMPPEVRAVHRLSSRGHWDVPLHLPGGGVLRLLAAHPTPPTFDRGRNVRRNRDEIRFWTLYLDGALPQGTCADAHPCTADGPFVLLGDLNADPHDGDGGRQAVRALLDHPRTLDPHPSSAGGANAATRQGGANASQRGDPALDTADWDDSRPPGNLRVDYVLPSSELTITDAGVFWPAPGEVGFDLVGLDGATGSHHRLVWVSVRLDR
jgi:endonuclease/exonuclease/phosphatase family metal-dependent hydrolase